LSGPPEGATNRLYKNNRDGTFTDVTEQAGLHRAGWALAVCVGDYNNDGFDDLFVTYYGRNVLYRNNGDGTFTDVTEPSGLLGTADRWSSGCCFVDYNRDGYLDLVVASYIGTDIEHIPKPGENLNCMYKGVPVNCGPRGLPTGGCLLFRNNGDGTFTDVSEKSGFARSKQSYCLTVTAADFDNDGWPDIYVACDSTYSLLFMNNRDGTFREEALLRGVALNEDGMEQAGMGVAVSDVGLNGNLDIFKTHFSDDTNVLYKNDGKANFEDVTLLAGLGVETRFVNWGAGIADFDNDGNPDLLYVTGNVYPEIAKTFPAYPDKTPRVLFRNLGNGKFEELIKEAGVGIAASHNSRGCAFGDFDNDGDIDVLIVNLNEPPSLLRNDVTGKNHWLKVKLVGVQSNRSAIGARVTAKYGAKSHTQEVASQSSFFSANDLRLHFGLGTATAADLEVWWPSGLKQAFVVATVDRIIVIEEGAKAPIPFGTPR
jgi:enediyne biosynthesis protein E4